MEVIHIHKMSVDDIPGKTHCWSPIVGGKVLDYKGEPPFCLRAAKKAASQSLGVPVEEITFNIHR